MIRPGIGAGESLVGRSYSAVWGHGRSCGLGDCTAQVVNTTAHQMTATTTGRSVSRSIVLNGFRSSVIALGARPTGSRSERSFGWLSFYSGTSSGNRARPILSLLRRSKSPRKLVPMKVPPNVGSPLVAGRDQQPRQMLFTLRSRSAFSFARKSFGLIGVFSEGI